MRRLHREWGVLMAALCLTVQCASIQAQESGMLARQKEALAVISEFSKTICDEVAKSGVSESVELTGDAKARLNGVVKKLADIGVGGAVKYQRSDYQGVLQSDLATAIRDQNNCRFNVFKELKDKILPSPSATSQVPRGTGGAPYRPETIFPEGVYTAVRAVPPALGTPYTTVLRQSKAGGYSDLREKEGFSVGFIVNENGVGFSKREDYVYYFDANKMTSAWLSSSLIVGIPSLTFNALDPVSNAEELDRQRHWVATICSEMGSAYLRAKSIFGVPLQEKHAYTLSYVTENYRPWIYVRDLVIISVSLFSSDEKGYAVVQRRNRKYVGALGIRDSFSPSEAERDDPKVAVSIDDVSNFSGDLRECSVSVDVGAGRNSGVRSYTKEAENFAHYKALK